MIEVSRNDLRAIPSVALHTKVKVQSWDCEACGELCRWGFSPVESDGQWLVMQKDLLGPLIDPRPYQS